MLRQVDLRNSRSVPLRMLRQSGASSPTVEKAVAAIIRRVELRGDAALRFYTKKFDGAQLKSLAVSNADIRRALAASEPGFVRLLAEAAKKIKAFHFRQRHTSWKVREPFGSELQQRYFPLSGLECMFREGKPRTHPQCL